MVKTGKEMIAETESLQTAMNTGIAAPVQQIGTDLESLQKELGTINTQLGNFTESLRSKSYRIK